jgi:phosphate-selective porin
MRASPIAILILGLAASVFAQSPESEVPPDHVSAPEHAEGSAIPEVPDRILNSINIETRGFTLMWGLAVLEDYTDFQQNTQSLDQVGKQDGGWNVRSFRPMIRGQFRLLGTWKYMISGEYNGFDRDIGDPLWNLTDLWVSTEVGSLFTLKLGKQKESFVYEMVGDAANLPHDERFLSPFFTSRNIGVSMTNTYLDERATWTVGWFNDWWTKGQAFANSGNDFAGRFTFLPVFGDEGKRYLHLAVAGRYHEGDDDVQRFRGKPQSDVATPYVDTGDFVAGHAWNLGFEALWADGPFSVLAEYVQSWTPSREFGSPSFYGWYATASWVFAGAPRPYDKKAGYARRVPVAGHKWGALELFARYGRVNLNGGTIQGGAMNEWYGGLNWFATKRWKLGFGYGNVDLDRFGTRGRTNIFLGRLQWIH